ncbi:MAG: hypothetical protein JWO38_504 [Gemmataceae bacterium]|nr:hypothetical protein [Gemmataceae bacterium]
MLFQGLPRPVLGWGAGEGRRGGIAGSRPLASSARTPPGPSSRAAVSRRGRIAVLSGVLLFLGSQFAFFPLSGPWPPMQDAEYGHKLVNLRKQIRNKPSGRPTVVMFGSSLTGWGLNPAAMTHLAPGGPGGPVVFNFGINSSGVVVELVCLKRLLAEGVRPDLVLIETHPWFLFEGYNHVADKIHFLPISRVQPRDLPVLVRYDEKAGRLLGAWAEHHAVPWYAHRHDLQNSLLPKWVRKDQRTGVWDYTDRCGWEGALAGLSSPLSMPERVASARFHVEAMNNSPLYPDAHRAYREIVGTCQRAKVPVVFVRMPEMRVMRQDSPQTYKDKIERCYTDLYHATGVHFVDARGWVDDVHFVDGFHLVPEGSVVFSRRLEQEILIPFVRSFSPPG